MAERRDTAEGESAAENAALGDGEEVRAAHKLPARRMQQFPSFLTGLTSLFVVRFQSSPLYILGVPLRRHVTSETLGDNTDCVRLQ